MKIKIRNPKAEIRRKPEIRNSKRLESRPDAAFGLRISLHPPQFCYGGRVGFRPSDFGFPAGGFTLIEIAISMAIIAFALTIIISILPSSMRVQRDVREETLVLSDGNYVLEAIRHGARNADALVSCVDQVTIRGSNVPLSAFPYSLNIVQAMTTNLSGVVVTMRSLGGSMVSQDLGNKEMALRYQITPEVLPVSVASAALTVTA